MIAYKCDVCYVVDDCKEDPSEVVSEEGFIWQGIPFIITIDREGTHLCAKCWSKVCKEKQTGS